MAAIEYDSKKSAINIFIDKDMKSFNMVDKLVTVDNHAKNESSVSDNLNCQWR
jgi:hypothetical protein